MTTEFLFDPQKTTTELSENQFHEDDSRMIFLDAHADPEIAKRMIELAEQYAK